MRSVRSEAIGSEECLELESREKGRVKGGRETRVFNFKLTDTRYELAQSQDKSLKEEEKGAEENGRYQAAEQA